jgi:hypothetical protein
MKYYEKLWNRVSQSYAVINRYVSTFFVICNIKNRLIAERVYDMLLCLIRNDTLINSYVTSII